MGPKATTDDGYERTLGVNYLGHFYLTYLLQDHLKKCAPSRIINVASDAIKQGKLDLEDLPLRNYSIYNAYSRSKLAQMMFTIEAHRHWYQDAVTSFAVHPGNVFLWFKPKISWSLYTHVYSLIDFSLSMICLPLCTFYPCIKSQIHIELRQTRSKKYWKRGKDK